MYVEVDDAKNSATRYDCNMYSLLLMFVVGFGSFN